DRIGEPVPAPGDVRFLGERKILVVARVVFADERPAPRPGRRVAQTSERSVDLLASVSQRDLHVPQSFGRGGKLSREKAGTEGVLRADRHRGPPAILGNEPDFQTAVLVLVAAVRRTESA